MAPKEQAAKVKSDSELLSVPKRKRKMTKAIVVLLAFVLVLTPSDAKDASFGCSSVIHCLATFVRIFPLRFDIDVVKIFDRTQGEEVQVF